jgi:hypothetical protein
MVMQVFSTCIWKLLRELTCQTKCGRGLSCPRITRTLWKWSTSIWSGLDLYLISFPIPICPIATLTWWEQSSSTTCLFIYAGILAQVTCAQDQAAIDKNDTVSNTDEETSTESEVGLVPLLGKQELHVFCCYVFVCPWLQIWIFWLNTAVCTCQQLPSWLIKSQFSLGGMQASLGQPWSTFI